MAIPASDYIDLSSLAELRDLLDTEMLQGLITEFIQDTEAGLQTVEQGTLSEIDMAEILHKMAGSAVTLGMVQLRQELVSAENALRTGQKTQATMLIEGLRSTWNETQSRLKTAL